MTVVEAYVGGRKIAPPDSAESISSTVCSFLIEGIAQNTTSSVFEPENGGHIEITGSPTEKAILAWGVKLGMRFDDARSKSSIIHAFPFNSEKKRGGVAVQSGDDVHVHWKGAAEIVLAACTSWLDEAGSKKSLDPDKVNEFKRQIEDMAATSLRCVALAYRPYEKERVPNEDQIASWQLPEDDLILLAIVGMKDPCRPGVKEAVDLCTRVGVKTKVKNTSRGDISENSKCKLIHWCVNGVVAEGRIASTDPNARVHHVPLGGSCWKVWIDRVFVEKVDILRPNEEMFFLDDVIGSTIAWLSKYIIV